MGVARDGLVPLSEDTYITLKVSKKYFEVKAVDYPVHGSETFMTIIPTTIL